MSWLFLSFFGGCMRGEELKDIRYSNSDMEWVINEFVHVERDRIVLKRIFIDGITYQKVAEEIDYSVRHISNIVNKYVDVLAEEILKKEGW